MYSSKIITDYALTQNGDLIPCMPGEPLPDNCVPGYLFFVHAPDPWAEENEDYYLGFFDKSRTMFDRYFTQGMPRSDRVVNVGLQQDQHDRLMVRSLLPNTTENSISTRPFDGELVFEPHGDSQPVIIVPVFDLSSLRCHLIDSTAQGWEQAEDLIAVLWCGEIKYLGTDKTNEIGNFIRDIKYSWE